MFPKVKSTGYGNVGLSSFFPNLLRDIPTSLLHSTNPGWWAEVPLNFEHPPAFIPFYLKLNEQLLGFQHHNFCRFDIICNDRVLYDLCRQGMMGAVLKKRPKNGKWQLIQLVGWLKGTV